MKKIKNILIVKLSSIGDVVHCLPFLEVVKEEFPLARIDWLVEEPSSQILKGHPALDRVIVCRRKSWQKELFKGTGCFSVFREATQLLKKLRERRYDVVVDLQGLLKSGIMVGLARGNRKIGMSGTREGGWLFYRERSVPVNYEQHAVDRYLQVAEYLGCNFSSWNAPVPVSDADKIKINDLILSIGSGESPLIAINPMARWKTKLWQTESFAALADRLCDELSCSVVFTGSMEDRAIIKDISKMMKADPVNLAGKTSLKELAYLYAVCDALVTTDTGPMHIAASMGCRVIALFGPTDPLRTGPYGLEHEVVLSGIDCRPCFKKKCEQMSHMKQMSCMKQISVEKCFETVKHILNHREDKYGN